MASNLGWVTLKRQCKGTLANVVRGNKGYLMVKMVPFTSAPDLKMSLKYGSGYQ